MCANPFSPPKQSMPAYTPPPPVPTAPEDDPEAQARVRNAKMREREKALNAMNQNVYTSGSGDLTSASVGKKTLLG